MSGKIVAIDAGTHAALEAVQDMLERGVPAVIVMGLGVNAKGESHLIIKSFGEKSGQVAMHVAMAANLLQAESVAIFLDREDEEDGSPEG